MNTLKVEGLYKFCVMLPSIKEQLLQVNHEDKIENIIFWNSEFSVAAVTLMQRSVWEGWGGTSSFNARNYWSVLVIIVISLVFIEKWDRRFFSFSLYFLFIFSRKWKTINEIWNPEKICQYGEGNILHIFLRNLYIYIYNFSWQHKT